MSCLLFPQERYLFQYTVVGCEGPAILLVHGFGAFLEHFRDNMDGLAEGGNQVWAITMLGFGSSEKPNVVYSEQMWAELLRDFIVEVLGRPVHLVGNSIGGMYKRTGFIFLNSRNFFPVFNTFVDVCCLAFQVILSLLSLVFGPLWSNPLSSSIVLAL